MSSLTTLTLTHDGAQLPGGDLLAPPAAVRLGADGLPSAFRILAYGPGTLTQEGRTIPYHFRPQHARQIVAHAARKGEPIPVDCEHAAFHLAQARGVEEGELLRQPLLGERVACGYVTLQAADDGLWAQVERWVPRAALLLHERLYRYFSPVLRGLRDGHLRLTSLALTNRPALDHLAPLVASAEPAAPPVSLPPCPHPATPHPGDPMPPTLLPLLARLAGLDALTLSDAGELPPDALARLETLAGELPDLRQAQRELAAFLTRAQEACGLSTAPTLPLIEGHLLALSQHAADANALATRVGLLEQELADGRRTQVIADGLRAGQLTPALVEQWAGRQDLATLTAYLKTAPVLVPPGKTRLPARAADGPSPALAAVARACGVDPAKVLA